MKRGVGRPQPFLRRAAFPRGSVQMSTFLSRKGKLLFCKQHSVATNALWPERREGKHLLETLTVTLGAVTENGKSLVLEVVLELLERPVLALVDLLWDTLGELDGLETTGERGLGDHLGERRAGGGSDGERAGSAGNTTAGGGAGGGPEDGACDVGVHVCCG